MQTLSTAEFNKQYPDIAWDTDKGFITFDTEIAVWAATIPKSKNMYKAELAKAKATDEDKKAHTKALADARAIKKRAADAKKLAKNHKAALKSDKPTATFAPDPYDATRYDLTFNVGNEERTRNVSVELANSLLNRNQREQLATLTEPTAFELRSYDFASILVANGKRPGIRN